MRRRPAKGVLRARLARAAGSTTQLALHLTLSESGSNVTGTGSIIGDTTAVAVTIAGTFVAPTVSLTLSAVGYQPTNYSGPLSGNIITGTLNGSGFTNYSVSVTRQ